MIWGGRERRRQLNIWCGEGYVVLERNWRVKHRELDVICLKGDLLVVVEAKTRDLPERTSRGTVGLPQEKKYPYSDGCLY